MAKLDRILLVALVVGVWALVLKPGDTEADYHWAEEGHYHSCDVSGEGRGRIWELVEGGRVDVYQLNATAECY